MLSREEDEEKDDEEEKDEDEAGSEPSISTDIISNIGESSTEKRERKSIDAMRSCNASSLAFHPQTSI